jgi:hypothetical protein
MVDFDVVVVSVMILVALAVVSITYYYMIEGFE